MLELKNISHVFGDFTINDVNLSIEKGEYFVLLGESGAGKSVILEIIAGLISADSGKIVINGKDISNEKIQSRQAGLLFQDHAVFPHMTVFENISYPLKTKKLGKKDISATVNNLASDMNISHLLERKADSLSGGEKQRVALARIMALNPACLLLDEPFASLDVKLKSEFRSLLREINNRGITILHVTHDYEEAIGLADKVAVIHKGSIIQTGTPDEVFKSPANTFVASFIGVKNFFSAYLKPRESSEEREAVINESITFRLLSNQDEGNGYVFLRSKSILISDVPIQSSAINMFEGKVCEIYKNPKGYELIVDIGIRLSVVLTQISFNRFNIKEGIDIWIFFKASAIRFQRN